MTKKTKKQNKSNNVSILRENKIEVTGTTEAKSSQNKKEEMPQKEKKGLNPIELIPLFVLLLLEIFFWRNILFNDGMLGDLGDGRFTTLITEHWWQFLCGTESFSSIPLFYPTATSLGYSVLHLGFGVFHSLLRLFGVSIYPAFKWSVILMHLMGLITMYILLRGVLKVSAVWSMI